MEDEPLNLDGGGQSSLDDDRRLSAIVLVDHTEPCDELPPQESQQTENTQSAEPPSSPKSDGPEGAHRRPTSSSLRDHNTKRKYRHFTEDKLTDKHKNGQDVKSQVPDAGGEDEGVSNDVTTDIAADWGQSALTRGRRRIKDKIHPKKEKKKAKDGDGEIDIMYENQRGMFIFGMPRFSSNALAQFEPSPWVDGEYRESRVDITNAQVPDPSWEWSWKTWYVDMSRDVDEEGWEYSFYFKGFSWHGTHPWFHSFVRRRRWIRKRERKQIRMPDGSFGDAHLMTQDYFTIHSGQLKHTTSGASSPLRSEYLASTIAGKKWGAQDSTSEKEIEISDIGALLQALKEAPVDSERILYIRRFLEQGGDDLYYLADEIPTILSYFFYENSSRRLLAILSNKINEATAHRDEHARRKEVEDEQEKRYIESLLKSAKAVDEECRKLGYWSDVRRLAQEGQTVAQADEGRDWAHEWKGAPASKPLRSPVRASSPENASSVDRSTDGREPGSPKATVTDSKGKGTLDGNEGDGDDEHKQSRDGESTKVSKPSKDSEPTPPSGETEFLKSLEHDDQVVDG